MDGGRGAAERLAETTEIANTVLAIRRRSWKELSEGQRLALDAQIQTSDWQAFAQRTNRVGRKRHPRVRYSVLRWPQVYGAQLLGVIVGARDPTAGSEHLVQASASAFLQYGVGR